MTQCMESVPCGAARLPHMPAERAGHVRSVAMVSTYPPTACGVATFTRNLRAAIATAGSGWRASVVRLVDAGEPSSRDAHVVSTWVRGDAETLRHSLEVIASHDAVVLQHEFRLFGGRDGCDVLLLAERIGKPLLVVLHTVPRQPSDQQREILDRLIATASLVVVQADVARERLSSMYGVDSGRVVVIPHGATPNLAGPVPTGMPRPAVLTWGLLRPGKGLEHGIAALARLRGMVPEPWYVIAGQTHPKVLAAAGEDYRHELQALAASLGVADHVWFDGGYQDQESLDALVRGANVILLPYESRDQVSSGVLVEALAAGKPVIATRFPHAAELLAGGAGLLVDHDDVAAMAAAIGRVLSEPAMAARMATAARQAASQMIWQHVGGRYRAAIDAVVRRLSAAPTAMLRSP